MVVANEPIDDLLISCGKCQDIFIVPASPDDAGEILELQKKAYQSEAKLNDDWTLPPLTQTLPEIISEFETKVFLKAVCTNKIIGSVRATLDSGTCQVGRLIVHPDYQGKGIGTSLMSRIEATFSQAKRFELFTGTNSINNIHLYQRLGYRELCEEDLSPRVRLVFMEKLR
ncbi:MAG: GNAT family N-acetyltransferase [Methanothrix sp.]|nr:GNAT family N-acetyltransferase [Methanothrix sp.]